MGDDDDSILREFFEDCPGLTTAAVAAASSNPVEKEEDVKCWESRDLPLVFPCPGFPEEWMKICHPGRYFLVPSDDGLALPRAVLLGKAWVDGSGVAGIDDDEGLRTTEARQLFDSSGLGRISGVKNQIHAVQKMLEPGYTLRVFSPARPELLLYKGATGPHSKNIQLVHYEHTEGQNRFAVTLDPQSMFDQWCPACDFVDQDGSPHTCETGNSVCSYCRSTTGPCPVEGRSWEWCHQCRLFFPGESCYVRHKNICVVDRGAPAGSVVCDIRKRCSRCGVIYAVLSRQEIDKRVKEDVVKGEMRLLRVTMCGDCSEETARKNVKDAQRRFAHILANTRRTT